MSQNNILILSDWFYPAYKAGGPITSLNNLVKSIDDKLEISVVTSAYDLGSNKVLNDIKTNEWIQVNNYRIQYLTNPPKAADELIPLVQKNQ